MRASAQSLAHSRHLVNVPACGQCQCYWGWGEENRMSNKTPCLRRFTFRSRGRNVQSCTITTTACNIQLFHPILVQDQATNNVAEAGFEPRSNGLLNERERERGRQGLGEMERMRTGEFDLFGEKGLDAESGDLRMNLFWINFPSGCVSGNKQTKSIWKRMCRYVVHMSG